MKKRYYVSHKSELGLITSFILFSFLLLFVSGCTKDDSATNTGPVEEQDGMLYNVAGHAGDPGGGGNDAAAKDAYLYWPQDGFVTPSGEVLLMDWNNHCVRKIGTNGIITRYIGSGNLGDDKDATATDIDLNHPTGIVLGPDGNLWMAAWHNWKVKKIDPSSMFLTAPIGTSQGFEGDGGASNLAKLDLPSSVVFDANGNLYISDQGNQRIRIVDPMMNISTFAGSTQGFADGIGDLAQFNMPKGSDAVPGGKICLSEDGLYLYVADTQNNRIRKINIATREVTTIAGTGAAGYSGDGGSALLAQLNYPTDLVCTHDGDIFIADSRNHVIRKIDPAGNITTVVGNGTAGYSDDGTLATLAKLNTPSGVFYDENNHTLYVCDTFNQQVKRVKNP